MTKKAALLLLPNLLGEMPRHELFLPASVDRAVESLDGIISESEQGGRRYLKRFKTEKPAHEIPLALLNNNTPDSEIDFLLEPMQKGERWGLVSDAGLPCVCDPGAKLVKRAKELGIQVQAFVGPSSLLMALMQSGLSGQAFAFLGYPPREQKDRQTWLKKLEKNSKQDNATQIFIEAPHRNKHTIEDLLSTLDDDTQLCVAWDLTLPGQGILTMPVSRWKKSPLPNIEKKPTIFLFQS